MHYLSWRLSSLVSRAGFWFGFAWAQAGGLLDKIPGFGEGCEEAYDRYVARHALDYEETAGAKRTARGVEGGRS